MAPPSRPADADAGAYAGAGVDARAREHMPLFGEQQQLDQHRAADLAVAANSRRQTQGQTTSSSWSPSSPLLSHLPPRQHGRSLPRASQDHQTDLDRREHPSLHRSSRPRQAQGSATSSPQAHDQSEHHDQPWSSFQLGYDRTGYPSQTQYPPPPPPRAPATAPGRISASSAPSASRAMLMHSSGWPWGLIDVTQNASAPRGPSPWGPAPPRVTLPPIHALETPPSPSSSSAHQLVHRLLPPAPAPSAHLRPSFSVFPQQHQQQQQQPSSSAAALPLRLPPGPPSLLLGAMSSSLPLSPSGGAVQQPQSYYPQPQLGQQGGSGVLSLPPPPPPPPPPGLAPQQQQQQQQQHHDPNAVLRYPLPPVAGRTVSKSEEVKRDIKRRTKTGCLTCRKRRIKCDEGHPACNNCRKSKRECQGYDPIFKTQPSPAIIQPAPNAAPAVMQSNNNPPPYPYAPPSHLSQAGQQYGAAVMAPAASGAAPPSQAEHYEYTGTIDPDLEAAAAPPANMGSLYGSTALPPMIVVPRKIEDILDVGQGAPPPLIDQEPELTAEEKDDVRNLYHTVYGPPLDKFIETRWFSLRGLPHILDDLALCKKYHTLLSRFHITAHTDYHGNCVTQSLEAHLIWDTMLLPHQISAIPSTTDDAGLAAEAFDGINEVAKRVEIFEALITNQTLPRSAVITPEDCDDDFAVFVTVNPNCSSLDKQQKQRELDFWRLLSEFCTIQVDGGNNTNQNSSGDATVATATAAANDLASNIDPAMTAEPSTTFGSAANINDDMIKNDDDTAVAATAAESDQLPPPTAAEEAEWVLSQLRTVLDSRENRDVLYSIAVSRHLGRSLGSELRADDELLLPPQEDEEEDENAPMRERVDDERDLRTKLAVASAFLRSETKQGLSQVVQRIAGMAIKSWGQNPPQ